MWQNIDYDAQPYADNQSFAVSTMAELLIMSHLLKIYERVGDANGNAGGDARTRGGRTGGNAYMPAGSFALRRCKGMVDCVRDGAGNGENAETVKTRAKTADPGLGHRVGIMHLTNR